MKTFMAGGALLLAVTAGGLGACSSTEAPAQASAASDASTPAATRAPATVGVQDPVGVVSGADGMSKASPAAGSAGPGTP